MLVNVLQYCVLQHTLYSNTIIAVIFISAVRQLFIIIIINMAAILKFVFFENLDQLVNGGVTVQSLIGTDV